MLISLMNPWYGENTMDKVLLIVASYLLIAGTFECICVFTNLFGMRKSYVMFAYGILPGISLLFFTILHWILALPIMIIFGIVVWNSLKHDFKVIKQYEYSGITGSNKWIVEKQKKQWESKTEDEKCEYFDSNTGGYQFELNFKLLFFMMYSAPVILIILCSLFGLNYKLTF